MSQLASAEAVTEWECQRDSPESSWCDVSGREHVLAWRLCLLSDADDSALSSVERRDRKWGEKFSLHQRRAHGHSCLSPVNQMNYDVLILMCSSPSSHTKGSCGSGGDALSISLPPCRMATPWNREIYWWFQHVSINVALSHQTEQSNIKWTKFIWNRSKKVKLLPKLSVISIHPRCQTDIRSNFELIEWGMKDYYRKFRCFYCWFYLSIKWISFSQPVWQLVFPAMSDLSCNKPELSL